MGIMETGGCSDSSLLRDLPCWYGKRTRRWVNIGKRLVDVHAKGIFKYVMICSYKNFFVAFNIYAY
jgi:hypothetical protein